MLSRAFKLVAVAAALIAETTAVHACGCVADDRLWQEVVDSSDVLFSGRFVREREVYSPEIAPRLELPSWMFTDFERRQAALLFETDQWWKGSSASYVEVRTDYSSCGLPIPEKGEEMFIEAYEYRGVLYTWLCIRSGPILTQHALDSLLTLQPNAAGIPSLMTRDSLRTHLGEGRRPTDADDSYSVVLIAAAISLLCGIVWWSVKKRNS